MGLWICGLEDSNLLRGASKHKYIYIYICIIYIYICIIYIYIYIFFFSTALVEAFQETLPLPQASAWNQWGVGVVGADLSPMVKPHLLDADLMIRSSQEIWLYNRVWHLFPLCLVPTSAIYNIPLQLGLLVWLGGFLSPPRSGSLYDLFKACRTMSQFNLFFFLIIQKIIPGKWSYEMPSSPFPCCLSNQHSASFQANIWSLH